MSVIGTILVILVSLVAVYFGLIWISCRLLDPRTYLLIEDLVTQRFANKMKANPELRRLTLYEFQSYSWRLGKNPETWHILGEKKAIENFLPYSRIIFFCPPAIEWDAKNGKTKYIGTYRKRNVKRFRAELRERGAELDIRKEMPALSEAKRITFVWP